MKSNPDRRTDGHSHMHGRHYRQLLVMAGLSFFSMFWLMYAMVNSGQNVYVNINQFYMAGLMTAPMIIIEVVLMSAMYRQKKINAAIIAASLVVFILCWVFIRQQTAVSDKQFLRSMIPHHAGALLMCKESPITDPEIKALCESIKVSQQKEIDQMKLILKRIGE